jgi:GDPmannose 4,6-dehydratase
MNRSVIIGHRGQDGRLLCEYLQRRGDFVTGVGHGDLDLLDSAAVSAFLKESAPTHIYYLAAFHHSSEDLQLISDAELFLKSFETHVHGLVMLLEEIRRAALSVRVFYAASSHVFGQPEEVPQTEKTPFRPKNIYGISKAAGVEVCRYYRKKHGLLVSCGILYNHESSHRKESFVSRKIIKGAVAIARGERSELQLGNLEAAIDWGYAPDFVRAMVSIAELDSPSDYIVATGELHTVAEFVETVFDTLGLDWEKHVVVKPQLLTKEPLRLQGDISKLNAKTGWHPTVSFHEMVQLLTSQALL